jgi:hypothetical protein
MRRTVITLTGVLVVGALVAALVVFQPWKLFVDTRVDEALPAVLADATTTPRRRHNAAVPDVDGC